MDLMRARVALRERPLLDVIDLAVRFCASHAGPYARLSLVVLPPAFAASWTLAVIGGWWLGWSAAVALAAVADAPFMALASRLVFADEVRLGQVLAMSAGALPRLIPARLLQGLAFAGSAAMILLPWLYVGTTMLFVGEVIVLEQAAVGAAMGRAQRIANAHFGAAIVAMLVLLVLPVCAALLADVAGAEVLGGVLEVKPPASVLHAGGSWLALLGWWAVVPLLATARFFVYLDVRTRTEGWDIQTRFAAIAVRMTAGAGSPVQTAGPGPAWGLRS
jgi:hypothetical protein